MLRYHPIHDPYHATFRFLRLLTALHASTIHPLTLRILDFYLLFPSEIEYIQFPADWRRNWKLRFRPYQNRYFATVSKHAVFHQLNSPQTLAMRLLTARGLLTAEDRSTGTIGLVTRDLPDQLSTRLREANDSEWPLVEFLVEYLGTLELLGSGGLKKRTGLVDHRYDTPN